MADIFTDSYHPKTCILYTIRNIKAHTLILKEKKGWQRFKKDS